MSEHDEHEDALMEQIAEVLRAPEPAALDFTTRLMARAEGDSRSALAPPAAVFGAHGWWRRRRTIRLSLSPLGGVSIAAGLATFAVLANLAMHDTSAPPPARTTLAAAAGAHVDTVHVVRFVLTAPRASSVSMVGDFNNWDSAVTPLHRTGVEGTWTVSVTLPPGAHQYAFVVDGKSWMPDPASTTMVSDDFGTLTSVIAVGDAT
jgi:hypothetical protein